MLLGTLLLSSTSIYFGFCLMIVCNAFSLFKHFQENQEGSNQNQVSLRTNL